MSNEDKRLKMAVIAGASHAIKFKEKNWKATEDEVIKYVTSQADSILENIDNPL